MRQKAGRCRSNDSVAPRPSRPPTEVNPAPHLSTFTFTIPDPSPARHGRTASPPFRTLENRRFALGVTALRPTVTPLGGAALPQPPAAPEGPTENSPIASALGNRPAKDSSPDGTTDLASKTLGSVSVPIASPTPGVSPELAGRAPVGQAHLERPRWPTRKSRGAPAGLCWAGAGGIGYTSVQAAGWPNGNWSSSPVGPQQPAPAPEPRSLPWSWNHLAHSLAPTAKHVVHPNSPWSRPGNRHAVFLRLQVDDASRSKRTTASAAGRTGLDTMSTRDR